MKKSTRSAFTLVELMIIVAIMADVMVVALPAYLRARNLAQDTKFISDLRTGASAFEMYAAENNKYPDPAGPGTIPTGMSVYLKGFAWSSDNSLGGSWAWGGPYQSTSASLVMQFPNDMDDLRMTDIDTRFDNGILATGAFREADAKHFYYIIEN